MTQYALSEAPVASHIFYATAETEKVISYPFLWKICIHFGKNGAKIWNLAFCEIRYSISHGQWGFLSDACRGIVCITHIPSPLFPAHILFSSLASLSPSLHHIEFLCLPFSSSVSHYLPLPLHHNLFLLRTVRCVLL